MPPDRVYRTEAIVMRRQDLGEADRIVTLYTRDYGKAKAVAKGVRKPTSRKVGHLELFTRVDVLIARGQSLDVLSQAEMIEAYQPLRTDLLHTVYASHFVELLDAFTEEGDASRPLFDLACDGLTWLSKTNNLKLTARYYELHLLELTGYRPELFWCVIGGEQIQPQDQFFSPIEGGVICPHCAAGHPRARRISLNALKVLRYLQTHPFEAVEQLSISAPVQKEIERLLFETLGTVLERHLKSVAFLRRLRRELAQAALGPSGSETVESG
jgi:DNA repair protein RecO (recombination protein O)